MKHNIPDIIFDGHRVVAGTTIDYYPPDSKELYNKHLKSQYERLKENGWINRSFTYEFNTVGFRSNEFTSNPGIVFLGCSHTIGLGLPIEEVYTSHISNALKLEQINLGIAGGSTSTCFRLAFYWLNKLKPKIVVYQVPEAARYELRQQCSTDSTHDPWAQHCPTGGRPDKLYKHFLRYREHYILQHYRNLLAIKHICHELDTKLILLEQDIFDDASNIENDWARDLQHYGGKTHKRVADEVLGKIK